MLIVKNLAHCLQRRQVTVRLCAADELKDGATQAPMKGETSIEHAAKHREAIKQTPDAQQTPDSYHTIPRVHPRAIAVECTYQMSHAFVASSPSKISGATAFF